LCRAQTTDKEVASTTRRRLAVRVACLWGGEKGAPLGQIRSRFASHTVGTFAGNPSKGRRMMRRLPVLLACVVMTLTLIAIAVATGASAAPKQQPPPPKPPPNHFYGAFDWSKAQLTFYWGTGTSKASVNRDSYNECHNSGAKDCKTVVWVYNGWAAIAYEGRNKVVSVGWGRTKQQAANRAVKRCGGPPCKRVWASKTELDPNKKTTGGYSLPGP